MELKFFVVRGSRGGGKLYEDLRDWRISVAATRFTYGIGKSVERACFVRHAPLFVADSDRESHMRSIAATVAIS